MRDRSIHPADRRKPATPREADAELSVRHRAWQAFFPAACAVLCFGLAVSGEGKFYYAMGVVNMIGVAAEYSTEPNQADSTLALRFKTVVFAVFAVVLVAAWIFD